MINETTNTKISSQEEAQKAINKLVDLADNLIENEATTIADKFGLNFSVGDYGSGRTYHPKGTDKSEMKYYDSYNYGYDIDGKTLFGHWISSSENC